MARMPSGKGKKRASEKGEKIKLSKSDEESQKKEPERAERSAPASGQDLLTAETSRPVAPVRSQEDTSKKGNSVVDLQESENLSLGMNSNGSEAAEPDSDLHRRIAERAFMLFQEGGYRHGHDWADWFEAERQIKTVRV